MELGFLKKLSISKKLVGGFTLVALMAISGGAISLLIVNKNIKTVNTLIFKDVQYLKDANALSVLALQHRRYEKDLFLNIGNSGKQEGYLHKFKSVSGQTIDIINRLRESLKNDPRIGNRIDPTMSSMEKAYNRYTQGFLALADRVGTDETITPQKANQLMLPLKDYIYEFEANVKEVRESITSLLSKASQDVVERGIASRNTILVLLLFGFVIITFLGITATKMILSPIQKAVIYSEKLSRGDFSKLIQTDRNDEIGRLIKSITYMADELKRMISDMARGVETLNNSSQDLHTISDGMNSEIRVMADRSNNVNEAAGKMRCDLNDIALSMSKSSDNTHIVASATEQMAATINEIAGNSERARTISDNAVSQAKKASAAIDELDKAADDIGKVTEAITEISEQTNLLALNATIEAARAGEAGKGFAVVANEIKDLARQTATATQDIKTRISDIRTTTENTVESIGSVTKVIAGINELVSAVASSVEEQSISTREIADNVAQISKGITDVNEKINHSSSTAEEMLSKIEMISKSSNNLSDTGEQVLSSSGRLSDLAQSLNGMVGRFKI